MAKDEDIKVVIKQKGTIPVYTSTRYGTGEVVHDETLEGNGTASSPLKISDEILQEIEEAGKVDDVYVNGSSVLGEDKIARVVVPTKVSDLQNDANYQNAQDVASAIGTHNTSLDAHSNIISPISQTLDSHVTNKSNPHEVTKAQVGLGNVDNTSDLDKPISTATQAALNAQQEEIEALSGRGRFLSLWNCVTGLPETEPETESPYVYHTGDYYIVGTVSSATPAVNYKPSGSSYVFDPAPVPSSVVETGEVSVNDTYVYDGENWILQSNAQKEVSFSALAGSPYDNTNLSTALNAKQNVLTAGTNIDITNNVISATATESFFRGRFSNWTNTPTDVALYEEDYHGNHTPTESDYMVLTDASDYVGVNKKYEFVYTRYHNMSINGSATIDIHNGYDYTDEGITFYIRKSGYLYSITADTDVIQNGNIVTAGTVLGTWSEGVETYTTICYSTTAPIYDGSWRFGYHGTWSVDGKNGWKPEYQVEETLPDATDSVKGIAKLYNTTGNNTDGSMTQGSVTTALSGKQDTLTAGTGISIDANNVISATLSESYFRGKFSTWDTVPTDYRNYYPDYTGNTKPTRTDYMVVEDSSSYVKPGMPIQIYNEPMSSSIAFVRFVFGATDITLNHYIVAQRGEEGVIIGTVGNQLRITYASAVWKVTPLDVPVIVDGVTKPINEIALFWSYQNPSQETLYKEINFAGQGGYVGTWRFGYQSDDWDASGKNGWEPEYQVEDVLPIADSSTAGIAKLYTTTGNNTDGAIDQNGTTTAINTAVSTHNTASNAHSNIRGTANGIATLDANAKVPLTQINDALLGNVSYQGLWNAATNDPFLIDTSGGLPDGYNVLEYIDFTGTQYINTGVSIDSTFDTVGYDIKFLINQASNIFPFGSSQGNYYGGSGCPFLSGWSNNQVTPAYFIADTGGTSLGTAIGLNNECEISVLVDINNHRISAWTDGGSEYSTTYSGSIYETPIALGCLNAGGNYTFKLSGRIYRFIIKKNGVPIKQYQPAQRLSDNAYGFYELVSGTFVTATGGAFTSGGGSIEIPKGHYYITSTAGTQFGIHFEVGDWVISTGSAWTKVDNTDAVSSVEGRTGNVTVINDSASTGSTTYTWSADKLATQFGNLGTAAYTASTDYATAAQGAKADTALQPADVQEYTANEVETLWNSI